MRLPVGPTFFSLLFSNDEAELYDDDKYGIIHEAPVSRSPSPVVIRRSRNEILGRLQCISSVSARKVETYMLPPACCGV